MKRREFIKLSSLLGAGAAASPAFMLGGCAAKPLPGTGSVSTTPTICDMCFWKCAGNVYQEDGELWKITGNAGEGTLMTFSPDPRKNAVAAPVVAEFKKQNYEPEGYTLYTYGAIQAWAQAVTKAGSTDLRKVVGALRSNKFNTVLGTIGFDKKGDVTAPGYVWYVWKAGKYDYTK